MERHDVDLALAGFAGALRAHYRRRLRQVYLFGSRARGSARPDSDVDLAVVLDDPVDDRWGEFRTLDDLAFGFEAETGLLFHAWPVASREWDDPAGSPDRHLLEGMKRDARLVAFPL